MVRTLDIVTDDEIPERLCELYIESRQDNFIGDKSTPSIDEVRTKLQTLTKEGCTNLERLGIMKILLNNEIIGFAMPRKIAKKEEYYFGVSTDGIDWYRLGTNYITPEHRGNGYMTEVLWRFRRMYPNVVWECTPNNRSSSLVALKNGLLYTHTVYVNKDGSWTKRATFFESDEPQTFAYSKDILSTPL